MKSVNIFVCLILMATLATAQSKLDKAIKAVETAYEIGDYDKATSLLEKFKKKNFKKLGDNNPYLVKYHELSAKMHLASGRFLEFETSMQAAISSSLLVNKENSQKHGLLLMNAAELYVQNGSYRVARNYLSDAKKNLEASATFQEGTRAKWEVIMAEAMTGQAFYNSAIELLRKNEKYFAGRGIKQETFVDDKGNLKSRKLSDDELKVRFREYARLLTDISNAYSKQGKYTSSDSAFSVTARWIDRNLGKEDEAFVRNQLLHTDDRIEAGLFLDKDYPEGTGYPKALSNLLRSHKNSHYLAAFIYEGNLKRLLAQENTSKFANLKLEYEKMIKSNYKEGSIYPVRLKAIEFDSKLSKDKTKNLEKDANALIANTKALPKNNIVTVEVLEFLTGLALYQKNYANAEKYLKTIIEIKSDLFGEDTPETHLAILKLANYYLDYTNNINEASKIYSNSYEKIVAKEISYGHKDNLEILNHLAHFYELTDRYADANTTLDAALLASRMKYDFKDVLYADELTQIARLQLKLGQYEKAETNLDEAAKILNDYRNDDDKKIYIINTLETQATLLGLKGLFDEAEDKLDKSERILKKADQPIIGIDELNTAQQLSSLFIQLGRYAETEDLLEKLIEEYEKLYGKNSLRLVEPLVNKGRISLAAGDYTEADKTAQRANQIAVAVYGSKSSKTASTEKLLADIDYTIGDYDRADESITKAMASQEKQFGRNHIEVAKSLAQLSLIKFHKGEPFDKVEKLMIEAQEIMGSRLGKENPQYADILKNVAVINIASKKYNAAFSSLTQAEGIWRTKTGSKNNINAADIFTLTGDVFYQIKNYKKAEEYYIQAKNIYEKYFNKNHPEYVKILSKQAKVYYMEKDFKRSKKNIEEALTNYESFIKQFFPALPERKKAKYWNTIKGDFEFYNTLAFSQLEDFKDLTGKVYNYQLLTKALLLSTSIKIKERILNSNDEALKKLFTDWVNKKEFLTNALSMSTEQLTLNGIDPNLLTQEVEKLERTLSEKSELFGQSFENKKITYENVQKSISKNEVAIEMVRYRYFNHTFTDSIMYVALYVKNDNARPKAIQLPEGYRMETRYFKYFRNSIISKTEDKYSYKVFWEPIQKELGLNTSIYLSPDGVYNQLNLEAIPTPDGKYVIDNSNIVLVSNTKDLYLRKVKSKGGVPSNTATMFGNPTFYMTASNSQRISSLPGTQKEIAELEELLKQKGWKTNEFVEGEATEDQAKLLESPKIFHIATHGFTRPAEAKDNSELTSSEAQLAENPLMKTGLLLKGAGDILDKTNYNYNIENGILTAYEAMSLNLDKTDLVVLSACETGLGEIANGEGVYGLQRAFLVAGAKVLIMSMFKVDDEATQKLVLNFYKKWLTTNNMRQSFIDAKKELRVEYPEPYYWGPFMMIGLDQ
ncbi:MAG: CHAT domain-containing protein [Cyclobacteriaceae bacterium]|nr:CHAT domain-containing protein [Cyclobacteriaceae bacterium]